MDGFGVVVVVTIGIIAAIAKATKTAQGTGVPGGRRLPPRPQGLPGIPRIEYPRPQGAPPPAERAETLVPDDLWALLTGQRREAPPVPRRSSFELPSARPSAEPVPESEERSLETEVRAPQGAPAALPPAPPLAVIRAVAPAAAVTRLGGLRDRRDLRRAMMLRVVLGPPKALE